MVIIFLVLGAVLFFLLERLTKLIGIKLKKSPYRNIIISVFRLVSFWIPIWLLWQISGYYTAVIFAALGFVVMSFVVDNAEIQKRLEGRRGLTNFLLLIVMLTVLLIYLRVLDSRYFIDLFYLMTSVVLALG